jgi:tRNA A37 threonylcarbamoyladenosine dehydratase
MSDEFEREELIIGREALEVLSRSKVAVFGVGGVGSFAAEALARAGVGSLTLVDADKVSVTNINRQLHALHSTVGRYKADVMAERIRDINPQISVEAVRAFYCAENAGSFFGSRFDYIVDAVDTVSAKIDLAVRARENGIPIISCMGAANKLDPTRFEVADIYSTSVCPLARVMRRELKKRGIDSLRVVYSREQPAVPEPPAGVTQPCDGTPNDGTQPLIKPKRQTPGSISFVPPVAGLIAAGVVVRELISGAE